MKPPVVMLGANFYTALGAIRTLGRRGVEVYALDYHFPTAYALSSRYVTRKMLCPDINRDEEGLAEFLLKLGRDFTERPVLMATADSYALLISRYAEELVRYYRFPDLPPGLLERIIDKKGLSGLAREHNLLTPQTFTVNRSSDLQAIAETISYPCIIKPALSHKFVKVFRQKCLLADNKEELLAAMQTARSGELEVMVQEIIPGFDDQMYVFDVYINQQGEATHTFSGQKIRQFPINFGSSTLTHHLYDRELTELGLDYMKRLGYKGYGEIEFKKHPKTGKYYLIEINARLSTLNILFDKCKVEFTYIMYRDLIGDPLPCFHLETDQPWAFWHAYEDMISITAYLKNKQLTIGQVLEPWLSHRKAHAIWATDDIKPLFAFARVILGKALGKLRRLINYPKKHV
jgi:D-aspartate ligase